MKVNSKTATHSNKMANSAGDKSKLSRAEVEAKIKQKFGKIKKTAPEVKQPEDTAQIKTKKAEVTEEQAHVGLKSDIANNDPNSEVTQEKLRSILKTGAFQFNDRERKALSEILKP